MKSRAIIIDIDNTLLTQTKRKHAIIQSLFCEDISTTEIEQDFNLGTVLSRIAEKNNLDLAYCYMNAAMAALLRQARQQCGFSQKELAQRVNSSGLIISRLETSRIQRVLRKLLNEIEEALQLPKNAIVSLQEKSTTPSFSQGNEATINTCPSTAPTEDFTKQTVQKKGYCRHCGTHLYEDSRFCSNCGKEVLF